MAFTISTSSNTLASQLNDLPIDKDSFLGIEIPQVIKLGEVNPLIFGDTLAYDGKKWNYFSEKLFILLESLNVSEQEKYITFDAYGAKEFIVDKESYKYTGVFPRKLILDIQFIYNWLEETQYPPRFKVEVYTEKVYTENTTTENEIQIPSKELIFNYLVGVNDYKNIKSLLSLSVIIDLDPSEKFYINIIKNNDYTLILNKNSNIKIRYIR